MFTEEFWDKLTQRVGDYVLRKIDSRLAPTWPRYMTIATAAKYLDRSPRSFEYLLAKDLFPVIKRDRLVLLDRDDIDAVMAKLKR